MADFAVGMSRREALGKIATGLCGLAVPSAFSSVNTERPLIPGIKQGPATKEQFDKVANISIPGFKVVETNFDPKNKKTIYLVGELHTDKPATERALVAIKDTAAMDFVGHEGFNLAPNHPSNFARWIRTVESDPLYAKAKEKLMPRLNAGDVAALGSAETSGVKLSVSLGIPVLGIENRTNTEADKDSIFSMIGRSALKPLVASAYGAKSPKELHSFLSANLAALDYIRDKSIQLNKIDNTFPIFNSDKIKSQLDVKTLDNLKDIRSQIFAYQDSFDLWAVEHLNPERNSKSVELQLGIMDRAGSFNAGMAYGNSHFSKSAQLHGRTITQILKEKGVNYVFLQPDNPLIDTVENRLKALKK